MPVVSRRDSEERVVAATIYGEARGEGMQGMRAVAHVINNRVLARRSCFGRTHREVCLKEFQFSVWDGRDAINCGEEDSFRTSLEVARDMLSGRSNDPTHGADHYHADYINPDWARVYRRTTTIGRHIFYRST